MHCATLEISRKDDCTPVSFMLIFCCLAGFLSYVPFILRSNMLLLIFPCIYMFCANMYVLSDSVAFIKLTSPDNFTFNRGRYGIFGRKNREITGVRLGYNGGRIGERSVKNEVRRFFTSLFGFCSEQLEKHAARKIKVL